MDFYIEIINKKDKDNELINETLYLLDDLSEHIYQNCTVFCKYYDSKNGRIKIEYINNIVDYILKTMKNMKKAKMYI